MPQDDNGMSYTPWGYAIQGQIEEMFGINPFVLTDADLRKWGMAHRRLYGEMVRFLMFHSEPCLRVLPCLPRRRRKAPKTPGQVLLRARLPKTF